ncbi:hypothetical protein QC764_109050 [Podospora pseudoanserina]|uniref:SUZ domain-containing protein n=1 Tax=Podospora pseudoanserina TaxID=2609844 RepID=A0ABR0ING3_9PEZI|nr:hypothetical protein QC764_109050 [Podospora pseudoanserina]
MSKNRTPIPDAWDDDWAPQADRLSKTPAEPSPPSPPPPPAPLSKAERRAKHLEEQRRLWESAEAPEPTPYLPITNPIPLSTPFKPPIQLLSRRPIPQKTLVRDPATGLEQLTITQPDDFDDEDPDTAAQKPETPQERKERQRRELEEKQRRYQEQRAKIFGDSNPSSGQSSPGTVTPPQAGNDGRGGGHRGRGGGGRGRGREGNGRGSNNGRNTNRQPQQQTTEPPSRELFDAEYSPKPPNRRGGGPSSSQQPSRSHTPREEDQITRQPRGPDGSGRGGFGFAKRGATNG